MRHWRIISANREFYGKAYWSGSKARAWGGRDYLDGAPQQTLTRLVRRHLLPDGGRVLEVGCAFGFLTRNLRRDGFAAFGCDTAGYCLAQAGEGVRPYLQAASVLALPYPDRSFDLVLCMEVLEHLPEELIPAAVRELRRVSRGLLLVSVPSYGPDDFGPYGLKYHTDPENSDWFADAAAGRAFTRLDIDEATGEPRCGHLTHATFPWWTQQFRAQGLGRDGEGESRLYADADLDLTPWQLYLLRPLTASWQGETATTVFGAGWADRAALADGRILRWAGTGTAHLQVTGAAAAVDLELCAGPRRLTCPYTVRWRSGAGNGEFTLAPGDLVTVHLPVRMAAGVATLELAGGPGWTTRSLFGRQHADAPVRGGCGLLALRPSPAGPFALTRHGSSDWQPAEPPPAVVAVPQRWWERFNDFLNG